MKKSSNARKFIGFSLNIFIEHFTLQCNVFCIRKNNFNYKELLALVIVFADNILLSYALTHVIVNYITSLTLKFVIFVPFYLYIANKSGCVSKKIDYHPLDVIGNRVMVGLVPPTATGELGLQLQQSPSRRAPGLSTEGTGGRVVGRGEGGVSYVLRQPCPAVSITPTGHRPGPG